MSFPGTNRSRSGRPLSSHLPELPPEAQAAILAWYEAEGRRLAFRETKDPYEILVSEAMAQQTQATRAAEVWSRFLAEFPSFAALASASPAAVQRAWRGLGYNRRALALRRTAIAVETMHGGRLPMQPADLEQLPGIGPYTARAVAAIAFGQPVGAVDTNVRRVLSRVLVGSGRAPGPAALQAAADRAVPPGRAAEWTHALMDLGATRCRPRLPRCADCPARAWCRYAAETDGQEPGARRRESQFPSGRATRERSVPFPATARWLRGRILDQLRDAPDGTWLEIRGPIGPHGPRDVRAAIDALVRDGLAERDPEHQDRLRLPLR